MITTIKHFLEGFFATLGEKEKESNSTKECCKKAVNNALSIIAKTVILLFIFP